MPERKKVAPKTYVSRLAAPSFSFIPEGETASDTIRFIAGEFTTELEDEQKFIESRDGFKTGVIWVKPSVRSVLVAAVAAAKNAAASASTDLSVATKALADYDEAQKPAPTAKP